ncbi:unnamed protein product [Prunus armeniaca]|uniref:Uncharacterized protein n=1 Tax=Prunus armeniaca TaxID=36596 RepID=A0A6J5UAY6_PRUAR|nr:unnamed protein product [Prunus armeniaca]CAB4304065.1 unnamed protein product [Prunus armeniaca]
MGKTSGEEKECHICPITHEDIKSNDSRLVPIIINSIHKPQRTHIQPVRQTLIAQIEAGNAMGSLVRLARNMTNSSRRRPDQLLKQSTRPPSAARHSSSLLAREAACKESDSISRGTRDASNAKESPTLRAYSSVASTEIRLGARIARAPTRFP